MTKQEAKTGDFIKAAYKCGRVSGKIVEVKGRIVVIDIYNQHYNEYTATGKMVNVTKTRISEINPSNIILKP